jgi:hypothetical protein
MVRYRPATLRELIPGRAGRRVSGPVERRPADPTSFSHGMVETGGLDRLGGMPKAVACSAPRADMPEHLPTPRNR